MKYAKEIIAWREQKYNFNHQAYTHITLTLLGKSLKDVSQLFSLGEVCQLTLSVVHTHLL